MFQLKINLNELKIKLTSNVMQTDQKYTGKKTQHTNTHQEARLVHEYQKKEMSGITE
jgi:hypothetical protein